MSEAQIYFCIIVAPIALYVAARIIFSAYYRSKADFLRRFFREPGKQSKTGSGSR
jgi:hypothetical protein